MGSDKENEAISQIVEQISEMNSRITAQGIIIGLCINAMRAQDIILAPDLLRSLEEIESQARKMNYRSSFLKELSNFRNSLGRQDI